MGMRLEKENVSNVMKNLLDGVEYWDHCENEAEKRLAYIAGVLDMTDAVIRAIEDLGGK